MKTAEEILVECETYLKDAQVSRDITPDYEKYNYCYGWDEGRIDFIEHLIDFIKDGQMETKLCKCGKKMIKRGTGIVLASDPPQYPMMWWCACGNTEDAGIEKGINWDDMIMEQWRKANDK